VTLRCAHQHASIIMRLSLSLPFAQATVPGRKWSECSKSGECISALSSLKSASRSQLRTLYQPPLNMDHLINSIPSTQSHQLLEYHHGGLTQSSAYAVGLQGHQRHHRAVLVPCTQLFTRSTCATTLRLLSSRWRTFRREHVLITTTIHPLIA
jgi:hypothetical protein